MKLQLTIVRADGQPFPAGKPLGIEVRDTSLADALAVTLKRVNKKTSRSAAVSVNIELASVPDGASVWAHLDVDRDGRVSSGDFVTVESYPVARTGTQKTTIRLRLVN